MKIQNKQTEVPATMALNDKDYINRLLGSLKEIVTNYAIVLNEASNDELYSKLKKHFDMFSKLQREIFEVAFQNGWYQLEEVENKKIESKFKTLEKEFASLACDGEDE